MSDQGKPGVQEACKDASNPPACTANPFITPFVQSQAPPDYKGQALMGIAAAPPPNHPFPSVMNAYAQWGHFKSFYICGASEGDRLYIVEMHTGYSGKKPLGTRPGMLLHNGTSSKDPIIAAAGDESQLAARVYAFSLESVILMPPLQPAAHTEDLITERMRARTSGDHVVFLFSIEAGHGKKMRRERFEWRKFKKGVDKEAKAGGFRLAWLSSRSQLAPSSSGGSSQAASSSSSADNGSEIVALLAWEKTLTSYKHIFTLRFMGSGLSGAFGERWSLMVVMTALRLFQLKLKGRTSKGIIATGEKIWDK